MSKFSNPADTYAEAFATLTPKTIDHLCGLVSEQVYFSDPFNQISGKAKFRMVFDHMYKTCDKPEFDITDIAHSQQASYLRWRMTGKLINWPHMDLDFEGVTEVRCNSEGLITHHIDHWDSASQLLQLLPLIGILTRTIRRLFRLPNH
jgi:hypothetical protein